MRVKNDEQKLYDIIYWGKRNGDDTDSIFKEIKRFYKLEMKKK